MNISLEPDWAWAPYEPTAEEPWDARRAAHFYRRAGMAASPRELQEAVALEPRELIREVVQRASAALAFDAEMDAIAEPLLAGGNVRTLSAWWVYRMLHTPNPLREQMTLFWHGHFATSAAKVQDARLMFEQNRLLRQHALRSFRDLVHAISRDPAMLLYLDSATNRKVHPNENYARELLELFCLGEGNYTEEDVRQAARCFTGWEIRNGKFRFNRYQHDAQAKTVLGHSGLYDGDELIDLVLNEPAAAHFIARKLLRYFVCDEPELPGPLVEPLAQHLRDVDWKVAPTLDYLFASRLFFSPLARGRKIKSPVEFTIGLLRSLEATANSNQLAAGLAQLGQELLFPPSVAGWEGGRTWINSSTVLGRANLIQQVLADEQTRFGGSSLSVWREEQGLSGADELLNFLAESLLATPLDSASRELLLNAYKQAGDAEQGAKRLIHRLSLLPEFQLS